MLIAGPPLPFLTLSLVRLPAWSATCGFAGLRGRLESRERWRRRRLDVALSTIDRQTALRSPVSSLSPFSWPGKSLLSATSRSLDDSIGVQLVASAQLVSPHLPSQRPAPTPTPSSSTSRHRLLTGVPLGASLYPLHSSSNNSINHLGGTKGPLFFLLASHSRRRRHILCRRPWLFGLPRRRLERPWTCTFRDEIPPHDGTPPRIAAAAVSRTFIDFVCLLA